MISAGEAVDMSSKLNGTRIEEATSDEKEANLKNNSAQCPLINEESVSEARRQPNCHLRNNQEEREERASIFKKIARNLDLDLLRDRSYLAIVLGRLLVSEFECG